MDFRDALEEGSDFDTSGALKGRNERYGAESFGRIPREYRASLMDAEYVVYSYVTPIAWRTQGQWVTPDVKYSVTTSRHQSRIFTAIEQLTQFS
jgi:hypothetical protein